MKVGSGPNFGPLLRIPPRRSSWELRVLLDVIIFSLRLQRRTTIMNSCREHYLRSRLAVSLSVGLLLLVPSLANAWKNDVRVNTASGPLQGYLSSDGTTMIWQGVPYAKSPVDDLVNQIYLRWKAPQDPAPWQGVREATKPALKCTQLNTTDDWLRTGDIDKDSGEDCLYVNVYTGPIVQRSFPFMSGSMEAQTISDRQENMVARSWQFDLTLWWSLCSIALGR